MMSRGCRSGARPQGLTSDGRTEGHAMTWPPPSSLQQAVALGVQSMLELQHVPLLRDRCTHREIDREALRRNLMLGTRA